MVLPSLKVQRSDSSLSLSTLSSTLAACLLLQSTTASGSSSSSTATATTHRFGLSQNLPNGGAEQDQEQDHDHSTVSVADDGRSGVGAAAAAAISVALARSWAAVAGGTNSLPPPASSSASSHPDTFNEGGGDGGGGSPPGGTTPGGKARFKLVAAVPRNLNNSSNSSSNRRGPIPGSKSVSTPTLAELDGNNNTTNINSSPARNGAFPLDPGLALESIDDAQELDDHQEATWRASGSHLKLHWLSAPSAVLVVYKPTAEVLEATAEAVGWLLRRGIVVFIEPAAYEDVRHAAHGVLSKVCDQKKAAAAEQHQNSTGSGSSSNGERSFGRSSSTGSALFGVSEPLSPACEAAAEAEESAREARADIAVDASDLLRRLLLTWNPSTPCELAGIIPIQIAHRLDLVLTLGGDGTVLWACSLFGNGSVPPIVPLAMGSLGFMTPFPLSRMDSVLSRVTSVAHGFPLMLRHRLQCRILRAGDSAADLASLIQPPPCSEDVLVLNEVVIDRGMTASLANLQCYVDRNFVTTILGDGLIVSTPTGSTAYNLAAGGSMVHPSVPCILFTPICAHTLSSRPLVFPEHVTLRVKIPSDSRAEAYCSFDGRGRERLNPGDSVLIHVSQWPVPMVCNLDSSHDWFLSVREGLNWNRRVPQRQG